MLVKLSEWVPEPLLAPGPFGLAWWQLIAILAMALVCWVIGRVFAAVGVWILGRMVKRTRATWDDQLLKRARGPLVLMFGLIALSVLAPVLEPEAALAAAISRVVRVGLFVTLFWGVVSSFRIVGQAVTSSPWAREHPSSRALVPLAVRVGSSLVIVIAAIALVSELGYPIASLVAGLGIGGLALALAGQKTVENLFGAFSIGIDQPFREGDFVSIEGMVGTVETVGLRSTRLRTLDRTVVTIPNGRLADMTLESFAARDRIRLATTIGLTYGTTAAAMRNVLVGIEAVLRAHPKIWPDAVVVRFKAFASSSLDIEVMAWFLTTDWGEFQAIRQDLLISFMEVVEGAGSSFAFPTQTLHVVTDQGPASSPPSSAGLGTSHGASPSRA